jgi:nitroimidazol reductase NimA-like FMN-containing flavoprotein (pyridoxamine 5'-phosphate oxidase superfamily)
MYSWQSVLAFGILEELEGDESIQARERLYSSVVTLSTGATVHQHEHHEPGDPILQESERVKPIMCRIRIGEMTGRFERR